MDCKGKVYAIKINVFRINLLSAAPGAAKGTGAAIVSLITDTLTAGFQQVIELLTTIIVSSRRHPRRRKRARGDTPADDRHCRPISPLDQARRAGPARR